MYSNSNRSLSPLQCATGHSQALSLRRPGATTCCPFVTKGTKLINNPLIVFFSARHRGVNIEHASCSPSLKMPALSWPMRIKAFFRSHSNFYSDLFSVYCSRFWLKCRRFYQRPCNPLFFTNSAKSNAPVSFLFEFGSFLSYPFSRFPEARPLWLLRFRIGREMGNKKRFDQFPRIIFRIIHRGGS